MDIKAYIENGVIESYVLGMAEAQEAAELEQLSRQYPEIRKAIDSFEAALEQTALSAAVPPPAHVKQQLFTILADEFAGEQGKVVVMTRPNAWGRYVAAASVILLVASAAACPDIATAESLLADNQAIVAAIFDAIIGKPM